MTAFVPGPCTVERQGYAIDLVVAAIANAALDDTPIVVGLFELKDLRHGNHCLSFSAFGTGKFEALSIAGPSRTVAEIEEELWHTRTSEFGLEGISCDGADEP